MKNSKRKYRVAVGIGIIVGVLSYLILTSVSSTGVYYYTLDEFKGRQVDPERKIRISGALVKDSVHYDPGKPLLEFVLRSSDGTVRMPVRYEDILPDNFTRSDEVVVTGHLKGDTFIGESLLLKCPSKYEADRRDEA